MSKFTRKTNTIKPFRVIRIYTEGEKTEPNYFNAIRDELRLPGIEVVVHGCGDHTFSLVQWVLDRKNEIKDTDEESEWWVVFDKDEHEKFEEAINLALSNDIQVAYSNESFELWFILHFEYLQNAIGRKQYEKKVSELIGKKYEKNNSNIYNLIKDNEKDAIRNAKKLEEMHNNENTNSPLKRDPSTLVYKLVERLRELKIEMNSLK